ncbi:MAG: hypothetical protein EBU46_06415 [Nitrosomonadaceae bacterium]|nr:hypothetical protein [Nitrosomonadaceae bacterium]
MSSKVQFVPNNSSEIAKTFLDNAKAALDRVNPLANTDGVLAALINAQATIAKAEIEAVAKLEAINLAYANEDALKPKPEATKDACSVPLPSNLTPRAQQVMALAAKETQRRGLTYVGTEQLLVGMLKLGSDTPIYRALLDSGADPDKLLKRLSNA